ncbi:MAG: methyltransferase, partial [Rikenellaceae bacterium]
MKSDIFRFKTFSLSQKQSAMKIGTDGVLLGAWATRELGSKGANILDIGSGTGVISLIAAHRCPDAKITAVEIDPPAANESKQNFESSPWSDRMSVVSSSLQDFSLKSENQRGFDTIITNPPYFINSLKNPEANRVAARHAELLPYEDLIDGVDRLLSDDGSFYLILPYKESSILL